MILKRLFPSNWRKDDIAAEMDLNSTPISEEHLAEYLSDANPKVRRLAYGQVTDISLLQNLADTDLDLEARNFAALRFRDLLTGKATDSPPLEQRIAYCENYLKEPNTEQMAAYLLRNAKEPELRLSVLPKVKDPAILTECALHDIVASLRLAAVEHLEDKTSLEQIARSIGKKDKGVYRLAKQRLKTIAEQEQIPIRLHETAITLCHKLERLVKRGLWLQDKTLVDLCVQQWQGLNGTPEDELVTRFNQSLTLYQQGYAAYQAETQARLEVEAARAHLYAQGEELIAQLAALLNLNDVTDTQAITTHSADISNRWQTLNTEATMPPKLQGQYANLMADLHKRVQKIQEIKDSQHQLLHNLDQARKWLTKSSPLNAQIIREWKDTCKGLANKCGEEKIIQDYSEVLEQVQHRLEKQQDQARQRLQRVPERINTLEQELDTGVLRQAHSLYQSIQSDLVFIQNSGLSKRQYEPLEQHLNKLAPRLRELQSWRKWGTQQHRLDMCENLERLINEPVNATLFTERVQALQREWKELDKSGTRVSESLRKRFHQAAEKVYAICRPYLEEEMRMREANRQAREEICQQMEAFLSQVDWLQMDWRKAVRAVREVRATWASLGPVESKYHHALNQRYRSAIRKLTRPLIQERARNRKLRQELIAQAQALTTMPDVTQAIQEIRRIQEQWQITVATTRSQEDTLWQTFRAACNQVFERRREVLQIQQEAIQSQIEALNAICEALETLAKAPGGSSSLVEFEELKKRWEAGQEQGLPRHEEKRLQRRWEQGLAAMRRRIRLMEEAAQRAQMERLRTQAALCSELETLIEREAVHENPDKDTLVANWQARWDNLPRNKDPMLHAALEKRFNTALAATHSAIVREQFQAAHVINWRERRLLCLQMEILAGIQSPPEAIQERLEFQVSRLTGRLSQGVADPLDEFPQLERAWYACGQGPTDQIEALEQRFERARRVLSNRSMRHDRHQAH